jgi:hypothetical protein
MIDVSDDGNVSQALVGLQFCHCSSALKLPLGILALNFATKTQRHEEGF